MDHTTAQNLLASLRTELAARGVDGCLIPMTDEYQSEYVPACARRIEFMTGFTGSAGLIFVLPDEAAFFTDSRYTLQAAQQIPGGLYTLYDSAQKSPAQWLKDKGVSALKIGYDAWLHTMTSVERWRTIFEPLGLTLYRLPASPVDALWTDRPAPPLAPIVAHELKFAGQSSSEKRARIAADMEKEKIDAVILTDVTSIAWLTNCRGGDVPHAPLPLSSAILAKDATLTWFVDQRKIAQGLAAHLGSQVTFAEPAAFPLALKRLGELKQRVWVDPAETPAAVFDLLDSAGAALCRASDPCALPKACKNSTELNGMRAAHRRDGAALTTFLSDLDERFAAGPLSEREVETLLEARRAQRDLYKGPSFDTIAGAGPNGAIVHYRATAQTNRKLETGSFLLLDSGGQYLDGTTDVTRTIPLGVVNPELRDRFTRVLKGHIALASIKFPAGTTGAELDVLARQPLWALGLDYGHGTGHGVGCYLSVHEGPQSLSRLSTVPLKAGMILSNEPGFYEAGRFGIRIENLMAVVDAADISTPQRRFLAFETLTLAPIDTRALLPELLTPAEKAWLNAYHARVRDTLRPLILEPKALAWLEKATQPVV